MDNDGNSSFFLKIFFFLYQEDPLEKETATHSSILAWRIPWREEPGGVRPWGRKELDTTEWLTLQCNFGHFASLWGNEATSLEYRMKQSKS